MNMLQLISSATAQGLLWAVMALGVYITYRLLGVSDLTVDGSFTTGGAVAAICLLNGVAPLPAVLLASLAGAAAGFITGFLNTRMHIPVLLSSILTQIALYTINLRIMDKPNLALLRVRTLFTIPESIQLSASTVTLIIGLAAVSLVTAFMYWFFGTQIGASVRATGDNPAMIRALGVNTSNATVLGLMLANALVATSGALVAQQQGFADIGMGTGAIVIGLAAIIIGEVLFSKKNFVLRFAGVVVGAVVYRIAITFVLRLPFVKSYDLKLFTALLVALALWLPRLVADMRARRERGQSHA